MPIQQLHHMSIVVNDLDAAVAFFVDIGMELEGKASMEGPWVDRISALNDVNVDIAMVRTPDGHGRLELTRFHSPAAISAGPENAPPNTLGMRTIMFTVDDLDTTVDGLRSRGFDLVGDIVRYESYHRLCYARGPEGIIVALSEELS